MTFGVFQSNCQEESWFANKKEVCAYLKKFDIILPDTTNDQSIIHSIVKILEKENDIYINDERVYDFLILCMQDNNSDQISRQCSNILLQRGNPEMIRNKSKVIKKQVSLDKIIPVACYLDLTRKEKKMVAEKSELFGRAYLGDEKSLQTIIDSYRRSTDVIERKKLARQLGIINSKASISVLIDDFCKDGYITSYNRNYSYKYWFPFAMMFNRGDKNNYFCDIVEKAREYYIVYAITLYNPMCESEHATKQREYLQYIRSYIMKEYGVNVPEIKTTDLLFYMDMFEIEYEDDIVEGDNGED